MIKLELDLYGRCRFFERKRIRLENFYDRCDKIDAKKKVLSHLALCHKVI